MTTRTWNNSTASFNIAADWSPAGVPGPGDTAVINGGIVTAQNTYLAGMVISMTSSASVTPTLILVDSTLAPSSKFEGNAVSRAVVLDVNGAVNNQGIMTMAAGSFGGQFVVNLANPGPAGTVLRNFGTINAKNASISFAAGTSDASLLNNGTISVWNPNHVLQSVGFGEPLQGTGTVVLQPFAAVIAKTAVASTQNFQFMSASGGNASLEIGDISQFHGTIQGLTTTDFIRLDNAPFTSFWYASTGAHTGTLTLFNGAATSGSLNFIGDYQTSNFSLSTANLGGGDTLTSITTSTPLGAKNFSFSDVELNLSGADTGTIYTGPVAGLQKQFIWTSDDPVAISTAIPNTFIKGGSGGDALQVSGGRNVLDGAGGSNFLVGGTGAGSLDTFFVDGRGGVETWSTIVNFHLGDEATIFGFHSGTSTLPFTASDGASGFEGVTIHSELNGGGTGVNASMTFTGLTQADVNNHFTITAGTLSAGTPDAIDYLLIQYNK